MTYVLRRMSLWQRIVLALSPVTRRRYDHEMRATLIFLVRNPDIRVRVEVWS